MSKTYKNKVKRENSLFAFKFKSQGGEMNVFSNWRFGGGPEIAYLS